MRILACLYAQHIYCKNIYSTGRFWSQCHGDQSNCESKPEQSSKEDQMASLTEASKCWAERVVQAGAMSSEVYDTKHL